MKRIFSIVLVSLLAINFVGGHLYFLLRAVEIKKEMHALMIELPSDQLEVFKFSEKAFHAAQIEERELQMDGKMYDIARIEKKNNTVHVYCLRDHAEENLLGFLDTMLKRLDDDSSQLPTAVFGFTLLQFIPSEFNFQPSARSCISILNTLYTNIYHFTDIEFETPPPRC